MPFSERFRPEKTVKSTPEELDESGLFEKKRVDTYPPQTRNTPASKEALLEDTLEIQPSEWTPETLERLKPLADRIVTFEDINATLTQTFINEATEEYQSTRPELRRDPETDMLSTSAYVHIHNLANENLKTLLKISTSWRSPTMIEGIMHATLDIIERNQDLYQKREEPKNKPMPQKIIGLKEKYKQAVGQAVERDKKIAQLETALEEEREKQYKLQEEAIRRNVPLDYSFNPFVTLENPSDVDQEKGDTLPQEFVELQKEYQIAETEKAVSFEQIRTLEQHVKNYKKNNAALEKNIAKADRGHHDI